MRLLDTVYHDNQKYRVIGVRQPGRYETGRKYELLLYGVSMHNYDPLYRKMVYASECSLNPKPNEILIAVAEHNRVRLVKA